MIEIAVLAGQSNSIDFAPANEYAEILQNIRTILSTPIHSVPLDRAFGIDVACIDMPLPVAKANIGQKIVKAIRVSMNRVLKSPKYHGKQIRTVF